MAGENDERKVQPSIANSPDCELTAICNSRLVLVIKVFASRQEGEYLGAAMAGALEEANAGLSNTVKDLFSGAVGGVAQVLIGMIRAYIRQHDTLVMLHGQHIPRDLSRC